MYLFRVCAGSLKPRPDDAADRPTNTTTSSSSLTNDDNDDQQQRPSLVDVVPFPRRSHRRSTIRHVDVEFPPESPLRDVRHQRPIIHVRDTIHRDSSRIGNVPIPIIDRIVSVRRIRDDVIW